MEILPQLDLAKLQEKANEYAMKGAEESLKDFYTGYNSPYKKAIDENLQNKGVDSQFDIPDIVGVLNDKFTKEVDQIANTAVAKSFLPIVKKFLTREKSEINFSTILEAFIKRCDETDDDDFDSSNYECQKLEGSHISDSLNQMFFEYTITNGKIGFELRFFKSTEDKTTIMSLPNTLDNKSGKYYGSYETKHTMKVSLDGATLELPFVKGILEDDFVSLIARLVIGNNNIIFDVHDFTDEMFPDNYED